MFTRLKPLPLMAALTLTCLSSNTFAADTAAGQRVNLASAGTMATSPTAPGNIAAAKLSANGAYVFSAPPRESAQVAAEIYGPIAEYLSRVTGKPVVYHHPNDWIAYQTEMRRGDYDLVFDGPHFNSWRAANLQHTILVKAPGDHSFVVAVKKDNAKIQDLKQLTGRSICGMSPPSLGTLTVLKEFDNPMRQPVIQSTESWDQIYSNMQSGRCVAAILPTRHLAKLDPQGNAARVIFKARTVPSQALSASRRVTAEDQIKITRALAAPDARPATLRLRDAIALQGDFLPANKDEYIGMASILKDTWGYQ
jgi:ABC-type phosphate/phosphonate transport system substrate-binding protein